MAREYGRQQIISSLALRHGQGKLALRKAEPFIDLIGSFYVMEALAALSIATPSGYPLW